MMQTISDIEDPRIAPYRLLKDRELAREGGRFIAESRHVVAQLLRSETPVESVLIADEQVDETVMLVPEGVALYCAPEAVVSEIIGYPFHGGVLACGIRPARGSIEQVTPRNTSHAATFLALPEVNNHENVGSLIRVATGLGVDAVLLGERCCDPYWRRSIRVSMGTVFHQPMVQCENLQAELSEIRDRRRIELVAAVTDGDAIPLTEARRSASYPRICLVVGSEDQGLPDHWIDFCDRKVTIPMARGTDSLNISVAAAICLHHFVHGAGQTPIA